MIFIRAAQHPAPPAPTAPATLPLSARRRVVLLMATVLQGLVFAVSRNIMNNYFLLECHVRLDHCVHLRVNSVHQHQLYQEYKVNTIWCDFFLMIGDFSFPSSFTPTSTGTCAFTVAKISEDICQLRLDFQTLTGFTTSTTVGMCTDKFDAEGMISTIHMKKSFYYMPKNSLYISQDK